MFKILINSCEKNLDNGIIDKCLHNLYDKIKSDNILVVVGDYKELKFERREYYNILYVKHNSIDFTALISVVENYQFLRFKIILPKFWFYIHDTSEFGELFLDKINNFFINNKVTSNIAIRNPPSFSMNIGLYNYEFLLKNENLLLEKRSSDNPSIEEIHKLKKDGIYWEGFFFNKEMQTAFSDSPPKVEGPMIIYNNSNVMRIIEYFESLDIKKYKANWYIRDPKLNYELNA